MACNLYLAWYTTNLLFTADIKILPSMCQLEDMNKEMQIYPFSWVPSYRCNLNFIAIV